MKERTMRIVILSFVFIVSIIGFSHWTNRGSAGITADMGAPTLPIVSFDMKGREVNTLVGHAREMNVTAMRDTIAICDKDKTLTVRLHHNEKKIDKLKYEIYSLDGKNLLHEDAVEDVKDTASISVGKVLAGKGEAVLKLSLYEGEKPIYYYTRITKDKDNRLQECVDYVLGLHEDILKKQNTQAVKKVMESNAQGNNRTLQHVTIHSDLDHVMWGNLKPEILGEVQVNITEAKEAYTAVLLTYQVRCAGDNNKEEIYKVREFFKVAQGKERVYLIEYDRSLEEVFQTSNVVLGSKGVIVGLADENLQYKVNEKGTIVAFVQANELWNYNRDEDAFSLIFSFAESEKEDVRNHTDKHTIQILSMDDNGNMTFSVCGYMNRGMHEGESGIAIYFYNQSQNCVEEEAFIPSTESALVIQEDVYELAYYNKDQDVLYVIADGMLVKLDMEENQKSVLMEGLQKGQYVTSEDGHLLAFRKTEGEKISTEIWDFSKDTKREVPVGEGEVLVPLGFLGKDFVYGISSQEGVVHDATGASVQPMHRVEIRNEKNEVVKTYEESGVYTLNASIKDNMITLTQGVKNGDTYKQISEDYITNNEASANGDISLDSYWTDLKETQLRFVFSEGIRDKKAKTLKPKQVIQEIPTVLEFGNEAGQEHFYVYGHGRQAGIFANAAEAIRLADTLSGVVISPNGNYVWEDGNKVSWYRNFNVSRFTVKDGESQLAACVRKILSYERADADISAVWGNQSVEQILSERIETETIRFRGSSAKDMCYLIDKGTPVIAMRDASKAVLLIGYDAKTVTYIDPSNGGVYNSTFEKLKNMTTGSGNTYIGYVK